MRLACSPAPYRAGYNAAKRSRSIPSLRRTPPMHFVDWNDYRLSRLMLGTVQFGLPYGVANRTGQPSYDDARAIVRAAIDAGVNCFDTAASYGSSEEVLGRALAESGVADRVVVVTKVRVLKPEERADPATAAAAIERSVEDSRQRLRLDCLPIVLFHAEADAPYVDVLARLQARGRIRHVGVSCDTRPGGAGRFAADPRFAALQIPGNVVDRRHQRTGVFAEAARCGVAVFLRSVYLQGLLLMPEAEVPEPLRAVIPVRRQLAVLAAAAGMQLGELALRFMLSQPGVTCVLTGVETSAQLRENAALFDRGRLPKDLVAAVEAVATDLPIEIVTPALWPKAVRL